MEGYVSHMTNTTDIAEGTRIYATETIDLLDDSIPAGTEGVVFALARSDAADLLVEWDNGYATGVNSGSVAVI